MLGKNVEDSELQCLVQCKEDYRSKQKNYKVWFFQNCLQFTYFQALINMIQIQVCKIFFFKSQINVVDSEELFLVSSTEESSII